MRALVVGGGPSRVGFDWSAWDRGDLTVACHEAARAMPFAPTVQLSVDRDYWRQHKPRLGSVGVWVNVEGRESKHVPGRIIRLKCSTGQDHWGLKWSDDVSEGVCVGGCSGVAAMNYATLRGATELHLVGIDLDGEGNPWDRWREGFAYAVEQCEARDVRVVAHGAWRPVTA